LGRNKKINGEWRKENGEWRISLSEDKCLKTASLKE
jgi:hypothetical protein